MYYDRVSAVQIYQVYVNRLSRAVERLKDMNIAPYNYRACRDLSDNIVVCLSAQLSDCQGPASDS